MVPGGQAPVGQAATGALLQQGELFDVLRQPATSASITVAIKIRFMAILQAGTQNSRPSGPMTDSLPTSLAALPGQDDRRDRSIATPRRPT